VLQPWDLDYYTSQARASLARVGGAAVQPEAAAPYLQVDSVISGLSDLMARTVGIELRPEAVGAGPEGWAPGVRRLAVVDSGGGRLGTLYLDLVAREGKPPGSVLFPIRCGRRLPGESLGVVARRVLGVGLDRSRPPKLLSVTTDIRTAVSFALCQPSAPPVPEERRSPP
jgi:Zn-dependent oligopeptidase